MSPLMELRVRACLERELFARRLQRSDPPEFTATFHLERRERPGRPVVVPASGLGSVETDAAHGALVVEICDARTLRRIWRGAASRSIGGTSASQADIEDAVGAALRGLPPSLDGAVASPAFDGPAPHLLPI